MAIHQTPELERCLQEAADRGASDVFLLAGEPPCFRVKGCIERREGDPLSADDVREIARAAIGDERLSEIGTETGVQITSCGIEGVVSGRLAAAKSCGEYTITVAILLGSVPDVAAIKVPDALVQAALSPSGFVIFAGLTGSGKTTTAYSVLEHINAQRPCHICTVEDPIATHIASKKALVQQREVGIDVPDCVSGVITAMRQDLDVLFVNEMKRVEELQACLRAAITGHMVFSHVHAATPEEAILRMIDVQPSETKASFCRLLSQALRAVSAQRLLPKASGKGRVAAYGVLIPDDEMRQAIADGRNVLDRDTSLPDGCQAMAEGIEQLRKDGVISEQTAKDALADL